MSDSLTRSGALTLSPGSFSHQDVYWALVQGRPVVLDMGEDVGRVAVESVDELTALMERLVRSGDFSRARVINTALIGLEASFKRAKVSSRPRVLQLETTSICNGECIMCRHYYTSNIGDSHAKSGLIDCLDDILPYVEGVVLHGYGEPFINPDLPAILSKLEKWNVLFSTNTNLSYIPQGLFKRYGMYFHSLKVSCDAGTKELYEKIRKKLSYDTFEKHVLGLREQLPDTYLVMAATVMRQNADSLDDIVRLAYRGHFDEVTFTEMAPDIIIGNFIDMPEQHQLSVAHGLASALEAGDRCGIKVTVPARYRPLFEKLDIAGSQEQNAYKVFADEEFQNQLKADYRAHHVQFEDYRRRSLGSSTSEHSTSSELRGVCDWLVEKTYIDLKGNVFPCCSAFPQYSLPLGNITEESFENIWNGPRYQSMRKSFYTGELPLSCEHCCFIQSGELSMLQAKAGGGNPLRGLEEDQELCAFVDTRASSYRKALC